MTQTLIQIQEAAITKLMQERSSVLRYRKLQRSVRQQYFAEIKKHCAMEGVIAFETWRDVLDMRDLHRSVA